MNDTTGEVIILACPAGLLAAVSIGQGDWITPAIFGGAFLMFAAFVAFLGIRQWKLERQERARIHKAMEPETEPEVEAA